MNRLTDQELRALQNMGNECEQAAEEIEELRFEMENLVAERDAWQARAALAEPAETLCACKDRPASQCPGQWEPGCDLGNNEKFVRVVEPPPRTPLTEEQIDALFCPPIDNERARWLRASVIAVIRKTEAAHGIKESE
jgi:hypothetical protein